MAKTAREIMNAELFSLRANDGTDDALSYIVALGITAAPVLDEEGRPIGVASFRDLLPRPTAGKVAERMTVPAITALESDEVERVAKTLCERGVHRVVVVDAEGKALGVASSLDVVRGLLGLPATHPSTFPHWDRAHGISWTDDTLLELDRLDVAPDGPGVLVLSTGGKGTYERVIWAEAAHNVRTRLYDIVSRPQDDQPLLRRIVDQHRSLRFRAAYVDSPEKRQAVAESLLAEALRLAAPAPGG